jgi:hypothetical protein
LIAGEGIGTVVCIATDGAFGLMRKPLPCEGLPPGFAMYGCELKNKYDNDSNENMNTL